MGRGGEVAGFGEGVRGYIRIGGFVVAISGLTRSWCFK